MNKLIIVLSGKKQSGKSSTCNYIRAKYFNLLRFPEQKYSVSFDIDQLGSLVCHYPIYGYGNFTKQEYDQGYKVLPFDPLTNNLPLINNRPKARDVKIYSFADPLKDFCINILGVPYEGCWGSDEQKNAKINHLLWENLHNSFCPKIDTNNYDSGSGEDQSNPPTCMHGPMSGREVMQVFGTDICRRLYGDCWALGTFNKIKSEGFELALVADARFSNEISIGKEANAKTIRLGRNLSKDSHASETALDNFSKEEYTIYIDNQNITLKEQCAILDPYIDMWFKKAEIK